MKICKKCQGELSWWSNFRDMTMKKNVTYAAFVSFCNGIEHMFMGNSGQKGGAKYASLLLYYCKQCRTYYIPCPKCDNFIELDSMPEDGQTLVTCPCCGAKTLYAGDYEMGGG